MTPEFHTTIFIMRGIGGSMRLIRNPRRNTELALKCGAIKGIRQAFSLNDITSSGDLIPLQPLLKRMEAKLTHLNGSLERNFKVNRLRLFIPMTSTSG